MAISEMSLLKLIGLSSEKDRLLDAFQRTGAVQIRTSAEYPLAEGSAVNDSAETTALFDRVNKNLLCIVEAVEKLPEKTKVLADGFGVTLDEFFAMADRKAEMEKILCEIEEIYAKMNEWKAKEAKLRSDYKTFEPYECLAHPFSYYKDTKHASVLLSTLPFDRAVKAEEYLRTSETVAEKLGECKTGNVFAFVIPTERKEEVTAELSSLGFVFCTITDPVLPKDRLAEDLSGIEEAIRGQEDCSNRIAEYNKSVRDLKLYADYLNFVCEKQRTESCFKKTEKTFVLEAYVPTEAVERVKKQAEETCSAVYTEFSPIDRNEYAPTLMKNKKAVEDFEVITNMYSVPAYGALDPNAVMSFFFSLFMGLIMADFGYGLLMLIGGYLVAGKQRKDTSLYRMARVFALGGVFALLFGALFDSWFGYGLLRKVAGAGYNAFYSDHLDAITAKVSLAGISIPSMLLWCLGLGTVHIAAGQIMKAVQSIGRHDYVDGIFGGAVWAFALFGLIALVFGMTGGNALLTKYAGYVTVILFVIGILTSGLKEKGIGKVTKIFTSTYGLINYMSDILSYARLYGLMLSGAQIASIFTNTLAIEMLFPNGPIGIVFGVVIIVFGNLFNVAMSLLGAYIHDSRLQYVEFFGKFYEGEGELFTPLGSQTEHIYFCSEKSKNN